MVMIYINNQSYAFEETKSLTELFHSLQLNVEKGVAVAINNAVVPRAEWDSLMVKPNDKLILIKATQGG
jgi:sulfur carrier protein